MQEDFVSVVMRHEGRYPRRGSPFEVHKQYVEPAETSTGRLSHC